MTEIARSRRRAAEPRKSNGAANGEATEMRLHPEPAASPDAADFALKSAEPDAEGEPVRLALELDQLRHERTRLIDAKEELVARLEERTRRAQQLLGERSQLEARLRERDQQIQRLNRELGAASRPAPTPDRPARGSAGLRLGTRLATLARRLAAVRPRRIGGTAQHPPPAAAPMAGSAAPIQPFVSESSVRPLVMVVALGLGRDELSGVLELASRYCGERAMRPLLLTDHDGLEVFRARRMLFEYLPPAAPRSRLAPDLDWDLYVQRRLALLRRKWQPARVVAFGPHATGVLRLWRNSPFEDESIQALIEITDGGGSALGPHANA